MQQQLISLNPDLNRLHEDGFDISISGGYLIVRQIPYVTINQQVALGELICVLTYASPTIVSPPQDHTIYFSGETPCNSTGVALDSIINNSQRQQLTTEIIATHYFSSRPISGNYPNYFEKIRTYSEILSIHAKAIDKDVTTKPKKQK
jgi:hypothetical protein